LQKHRGAFHDGNVPSSDRLSSTAEISVWLEKAKQLAQGEKKIEPFSFQPASCVKLNNVDGARKLLDNIYNQIQADKLTEIIETCASPVPNKNENPRFLFTVKIATAENLAPLDSSPSSTLDTFVTLSDQDGRRVAKTRTIYETLNPQCRFSLRSAASQLEAYHFWKHRG
jgi:hypothetical protein